MWLKIFSSASSFKQYRDSSYFKDEPRFNGVFSKKNLPRINDGAYAINVDDKNSKEKLGFHYLLKEI